jgi:hypothetical protein
MTQPTPARVRTRICGDCDGFPVVAIDTGTRNPDGGRRTLPVICQSCHGAGTVLMRRLVAGGRA